MGVMLLCDNNDGLHPMLHAARHGFFSMALPMLKTIVKDSGINTPGVTLPLTLTAVVQHMVQLHTGTPITDAELQAILSLRSVEEESEIPNFCDEDMLLEVLEKEDLKAFQVFSYMGVGGCRRGLFLLRGGA